MILYIPILSTSLSDSNYGPHFVIKNSFGFSQYKDMFRKTKCKIYYINVLSKDYNNKELCVALSVQYIIIEEPNFS